jgi:predicted peptidase
MKRFHCLIWLVPCLFILACQSDKKAQPSRPVAKATSLEAIQLTPLPVGVHQQTTSIPTGGTLRYTVSVPTGYDPQKPCPLIVVLHYGGDVTPFYGREMIDDLVTPALDSLRAVVIAPDSLGGDWTYAQNEKAVVWLTQSIMKSYAIDAKKVLLTGYSMGGKGTWFIGSRHQDLFTAAIPVGGEPAHGPDWKIPLYVIHSRKDEVIPIAVARQQVEQLKARGMKVEFKEVTNLTHFQTPEYAGPLKETLPWLLQVWK